MLSNAFHIVFYSMEGRFYTFQNDDCTIKDGICVEKNACN